MDNPQLDAAAAAVTQAQSDVDAATSQLQQKQETLKTAEAAYQTLVTQTPSADTSKLAADEAILAADIKALSTGQATTTAPSQPISGVALTSDQVLALDAAVPVSVNAPVAGVQDGDLAPLGPIAYGWGSWDTLYHARGWAEGSFHWLPSNYNNVTRDPTTNAVKMALNINGEAALQTSAAMSSSQQFVRDVTFDQMRSGVVSAPLWLYTGTAGGDEIDIEIAGLNGMQLNVHSNGQTLSQPFTPPGWGGDISGKRAKIGIVYKGGQFISFTIDGTEVFRIDSTNAPGGVVPSAPMSASASIWAYPSAPGWVGAFVPPAGDEEAAFTIHGEASETI